MSDGEGRLFFLPIISLYGICIKQKKYRSNKAGCIKRSSKIIIGIFGFF